MGQALAPQGAKTRFLEHGAGQFLAPQGAQTRSAPGQFIAGEGWGPFQGVEQTHPIALTPERPSAQVYGPALDRLRRCRGRGAVITSVCSGALHRSDLLGGGRAPV